MRSLYGKGSFPLKKFLILKTSLMLESLRASRIRQTSRISQNTKMSRKKQRITILMAKKLRETTNLGVEIMNSKRQVKRKLGHVVQIRVCRLT